MAKKDARTYADITREIESLQQQAQEVLQHEVAGVIAKINEAIAFYGIQPGDLTFARTRGPKPRRTAVVEKKKVAKSAPRAARYRDGEGRTWSGRGPRPGWLREALAQGKTLEDFAVPA